MTDLDPFEENYLLFKQAYEYKKSLAEEHIKNALDYVDLNQLIEIAERVYSRDFAQGEIASAGKFN